MQVRYWHRACSDVASITQPKRIAVLNWCTFKLLLILCFILLHGQVFLDLKEQNNTEYKLESFASVYRKLSGKDVVFEYRNSEA